MGAAGAGHPQALQATFEAASEAIGELVTGALRKGLSLDDLAVVVERSLSGQTRVGCTGRADAARSFGADPRLNAEARESVARSCTSAARGELPIVVVVVLGAGAIAIGVRRERGSFVGVA